MAVKLPTVTINIPLVSSSVSAGFPSPADDFVEKNIDLNKYLIKHPAATFFVRVAGESMRDAGIMDGDMLIVDRAIEPYPSCIAVAVLDGEFTVKRINKKGNSVYLSPENDSFRDIPITNNNDFHVWGVVTHVIHQIHSSSIPTRNI